MNNGLKKRMEIEVVADDSKAKTTLQKLSDYLKKDFESGAKSAKVTMDTGEAKIKIIELQKEIKELQKFVDSLSSKEVNSELFQIQVNRLKEAKIELEKLQNLLGNTKDESNSTSKSINTLGKTISDSIEKASKKTKKFVLSLFSIRSAWALISRASGTYMNENEETANKVSAIWSYLGNMLGPIIEKIVSWLQYGIAYLNVFVRRLTGIDLLAKSIQKSAAKTNKEIKKTLSSMDEIVNLDIDNGNSLNPAGALQDINDLVLDPKITKFMEDLADVLKNVWDWAKKTWDVLEQHFGPVGAGIIVGGLALLLGSGGFGGLVALLAGGFAIKFIYEGITGRELLQDINDIINGLEELKSISQEFVEQSKKSLNENKNATDALKDSIDTMTNDQLLNFIDKTGLAIETNREYRESLEKNLNWVNILNGSYDDYEKAIDNVDGSLNEHRNRLEYIISYLQKQQEQVKKDSEEYIELDKTIGKVKDTLKKIDGTIATTTVEVDLDTHKYETKAGNFFTGVGNLFTNLLHGKISTKNLGYATGGFPENGQVFIANEKEPELIGNIGSSTAVVNNSQIVDSVSQGVANAVSDVLANQKSSTNQVLQLNVNGHEFAKATFDDYEEERTRRNPNTSIRRY